MKRCLTKQFAVLFLACSMVTTLCTSACTTVSAEPIDTFIDECNQALLLPSENGPIMRKEDHAAILSDFAFELRFIADVSDTAITEITPSTLDIIKSVSSAHYNDPQYRFSDLLSAISIAVLEKNFEDLTSSQSSRARASQFEVTNLEVDSISPLAPLIGKIHKYAPVNATIEDSVTVGIEAGGTVGGVTITVGCSESTSYSITGPSANQTLHNGIKASHAAAFAVLFGQIQRVSYNVLDRASGDTVQATTVQIVNAYAMPYTLFVAAAIPTYADHVFESTTLSFATQPAFERNAQNSPAIFLE